MTFIGRDQERTTLRNLWDGTESTGAALALIQGQAGFGKTSLLTEFLSHIEPTALQATGEPDEKTLPYGVIGQLLRGVDLTGRRALTRVVGNDPAGLDPLEVGSDLLDFLATVGARGLVLTVDDVQWADPMSVRALVFALRRLRAERLLTVLCCRSDELDRLPIELQRLLGDAAVRIGLPALNVDETEALARAMNRTDLGRAVLTRVVEHSGGSPLYTRALLEEFSSAELGSDPRRPLPAPKSFSELVVSRVAACGPDGTALVHAAAILGDGAAMPVLIELGELSNPALAIEQAVAAALVADIVADGIVRFRHPLVRSAVYHSIPASLRTGLHLRASRLIADTDRIGALRHRVSATTGTDRELAAEVAGLADLDAKAGWWVVAAERYKTAVRLSDPTDEAVERYTLRMVECLALVGNPLATIAAERTISAHPRSALVDFALGRLRSISGDWDAAQELLDAAWTSVNPQTDVELVARIASELARNAVMGGRGAAAFEWASHALSVTPPEMATDTDTMALMAVAMGIQGQAAQALEFMAGLPRHVVNPSPAELGAIGGRGMLSLWNADLAQARTDLSAVVTATGEHGPTHANLFARQYLADVEYRTGDWDIAIVEAEAGVAAARDLGNVWTLPMLHAVASLPHSARGNFAQAAVHVAAAAEHAAVVGDVPNRVWAVVAAARLAYASRDPDAVVAALQPMGELAALDGVREPGIQPWQPMHAAALIALGRFDQAAVVLEEAEFFANSRQHSVQLLAVRRERCMLLAGQGNLNAALVLLKSAGALYPAVLALPFERAQFDLVSGRLLRLAGRKQAAIASLERARTALGMLRATPWLAEANHELAHLGGRPSARNRNGTTELSPHEVAVARLVTEGLTNREIASRLMISTKTVDYHLGHVYSKVGVRSRVQLTNRLVHDSDFPPPPNLTDE
ncbi:MAG: AAA family ATPase [Jatrophihabitantaceae bacterium]